MDTQHAKSESIDALSDLNKLASGNVSNSFKTFETADRSTYFSNCKNTILDPNIMIYKKCALSSNRSYYGL